MTQQHIKTIIRPAEASEYPILVEIWERSVRATHHFLHETDLQEIKNNMPTLYLPHVRVFVALHNDEIVGFIGVSSKNIEMLFIDAPHIGNGYGSELLEHALDLGIRQVDVNEQNKRALRFYLNKGFKVTSRDNTDADGRNYPILHLSL